VFSASAVQTAIIATISQHHSPRVTRKANPATHTATVAAACTHALCCDASISLIPRKAK
jgi:hypothetical protein